MGEHDEWRGHPIEMVGKDWVYSDTRQKVSADKERDCGSCGLTNTPDGHDGCLGTLSGVANACCGHGRALDAYIQYEDGRWVGGPDALALMLAKKKPPI